MSTVISNRSPRGARGFTLIELMVAMVIGLIVIGAVLALSLSMIRANSDTIAGTRLTQELRSTATVITSELQRAGGVADPFNLTAAEDAVEAFDVTTPGCVRYSYSFWENGAIQVVTQAISRQGTAIFVGNACGSGSRLSSNAVNISNLAFARNGRTISLALRGGLKLSKGETVEREYVQTVFAPGLLSPPSP